MNNMSKSKKGLALQLLERLRKGPMTYGQMQQFVWEAAGREGKHSEGWWGTNIAYFKHSSKVIRKLKSGKYTLTKWGRQTTKPYARSPKETARIKRIQQKRYEQAYRQERERNMKLSMKNHELRNELAHIKQQIDRILDGGRRLW